MTTEDDTLDWWIRPRSAQEEALRGDLQLVHDSLRELLGCFNVGSHRGDRVVRTAEIDEQRVYDLYDMLTELRAKHSLADR